eukprot:2442045-Pleurochrysis_carterae.AAC.1
MPRRAVKIPKWNAGSKVKGEGEVAAVIGAQRLLFDPGTRDVAPSRTVSNACALFLTSRCACAAALIAFPATNALSTWLRFAWRAQAKAAQRRSAFGDAASVAGIDGRTQRCTVIMGDLPLHAHNSNGAKVEVTLRNVRCVPSSPTRCFQYSSCGTPRPQTACLATFSLLSRRLQSTVYALPRPDQ